MPIYKMKHPTFPGSLQHKDGKSQKHDRDCPLRYGDTAYGVMGTVVPGLHYTTPFRRQPGKDMTPEQRAFNREHSRVRIRVENGIRRTKIFRIMKEQYGNRLRKYDRINDIVCGVVNQAILMKRAGTL